MMQRERVEEWCRQHIGKARLVKLNMRGVCPRCGHDEKFGVHVEKLLFNCWRVTCGYRGSFAQLVADVEGIALGAAIEQWQGRSRPERRLCALATSAAALRRKPGMVDYALPAHRPCVDPRTGELFVPPYLIGRCTNLRAIKDMGMAIATSDRENNRVIVPIRCPNGRAWIARDMTGKSRHKYLAPEGSDEEFKRLVVQSPGYVPGGDLLVVEGSFDVARCYEHELHAWGLLGSTLHDEQLSMFFALPPYTRVYWGLDNNVSILKIDAMCRKLSVKFQNQFIVRWPDGTDPGSCTAEQARNALLIARRWGHCAPNAACGPIGG